MKVTNLRLGNYVLFDRGIGRIIALCTKEYAEDDYVIVVEEIESGIHYDCIEGEVEGVPLTYEMKEKYSAFACVEYLHELQNRYFYIAHDELKCEKYVKSETLKNILRNRL